MKAVIQRVTQASVKVDDKVVGQIGQGILVLLGAAKNDTDQDIDYLIQKLIHLRMFNDADGKMNLSVQDIDGAFLVVSQFTLLGNCKKGRRPSFDQAASPVDAEAMYHAFVDRLRATGVSVETGVFRAMMDVQLTNDGPVTFILDSKL